MSATIVTGKRVGVAIDADGTAYYALFQTSHAPGDPDHEALSAFGTLDDVSRWIETGATSVPGGTQTNTKRNLTVAQYVEGWVKALSSPFELGDYRIKLSPEDDAQRSFVARTLAAHGRPELASMEFSLLENLRFAASVIGHTSWDESDLRLAPWRAGMHAAKLGELRPGLAAFAETQEETTARNEAEAIAKERMTARSYRFKQDAEATFLELSIKKGDGQCVRIYQDYLSALCKRYRALFNDLALDLRSLPTLARHARRILMDLTREPLEPSRTLDAAECGLAESTIKGLCSVGGVDGNGPLYQARYEALNALDEGTAVIPQA